MIGYFKLELIRSKGKMRITLKSSPSFQITMVHVSWGLVISPTHIWKMPEGPIANLVGGLLRPIVIGAP